MGFFDGLMQMFTGSPPSRQMGESMLDTAGVPTPQESPGLFGGLFSGLSNFWNAVDSRTPGFLSTNYPGGLWEGLKAFISIFFQQAIQSIFGAKPGDEAAGGKAALTNLQETANDISQQGVTPRLARDISVSLQSQPDAPSPTFAPSRGRAADSQGPTIVAWGDSQAQGIGANLKVGGRRVLNLGVAGDSLEKAKTRVGQIPAGAVVLMHIGTNDIAGLAPDKVDAYADKVLAVAREIQAKGGKPIIIGLQRPQDAKGDYTPYTENPSLFNDEWLRKMNAYNAALEKKAKAGITFYSTDGIATNLRAPDHLHYTAQGYNEMGTGTLKAASIDLSAAPAQKTRFQGEPSTSSEGGWQSIPLTSQAKVSIPPGFKPNPDGTYNVIYHFHGVENKTQQALGNTNAVIVSVNCGNGSGAYEKAFSNPQAFKDLMAQTDAAMKETGRFGSAEPKMGEVALSSWSAGYGAVQKILGQPGMQQRVSSVFIADGLHDNREAMQHVIEFAKLARDGKKTFSLTHSSIVPPYTSTTQTADLLLAELGIQRQAVNKEGPGNMHQTSFAQRGNFTLAGYDGKEAKHHIDHIRHMGANLYSHLNWPRNSTQTPEMKASSPVVNTRFTMSDAPPVAGIPDDCRLAIMRNNNLSREMVIKAEKMLAEGLPLGTTRDLGVHSGKDGKQYWVFCRCENHFDNHNKTPEYNPGEGPPRSHPGSTLYFVAKNGSDTPYLPEAKPTMVSSVTIPKPVLQVDTPTLG